MLWKKRWDPTPEHPEWFLPQRLLYLQTEHQKNPPIEMHMEVPERIKRIVAREEKKKKLEEQTAPQDEVVVPLAPAGGRPARLTIHEGPAYVDVTYGDRGQYAEMVTTSGDLRTWSQGDREPYTLDPCARPPQVPPLSMFLRDELVPEGVPLDVLAKMVAELRPDVADKGRVFLPVVQPGTVTGAWCRGLRNLRVAEWDGALGAAAGWAVVDAWNGTAVATGPTLDAAFAAWREQIAASNRCPRSSGQRSRRWPRQSPRSQWSPPSPPRTSPWPRCRSRSTSTRR